MILSWLMSTPSPFVYSYSCGDRAINRRWSGQWECWHCKSLPDEGQQPQPLKFEVHLGSGSKCITALVDNVQVTGTAQVNGIRVRRFSDRVCISGPNCEYLDLVMWVMYQKRSDQSMLKFVITRGYNLAPPFMDSLVKLECNKLQYCLHTWGVTCSSYLNHFIVITVAH